MQEKNIFKKNEDGFTKILSKEILKNEDKRTLKVVELIVKNLKEICKQYPKQNCFDEFDIIRSDIDDLLKGREMRKRDEKTPSMKILQELITDENFIKILTTRRLDLFVKFWETLLEKNISTAYGIKAIINSLFLNEESFLYKQHRNYLSIPIESHDIYQIIFSHKSIQNISIYQELVYYGNPKNKKRFIDILINSLKVSIENYLLEGAKESGHTGNFENISYGFNILIESVENSLMKKGKNENDILNAISHFFSHTIPFIFRENDFDEENFEKLKKEYKKSEESRSWSYGMLIGFRKQLLLKKHKRGIPIDEKRAKIIKDSNRRMCEETRIPPYNEGSIENYLAYYIYKLFKTSNKFIGREEKRDDDIRNLLLDSYTVYDTPKRYIDVVALFHLIMRNEINKELEAYRKKGYYYNGVIKAFLLFTSFSLIAEWKDGEMKTDILHEKDVFSNEQMKDFMIEKLYTDIKEMIESNKKQINGRPINESLLPKNIVYENKKFYWKQCHNQLIEIKQIRK